MMHQAGGFYSLLYSLSFFTLFFNIMIYLESIMNNKDNNVLSW